MNPSVKLFLYMFRLHKDMIVYLDDALGYYVINEVKAEKDRYFLVNDVTGISYEKDLCCYGALHVDLEESKRQAKLVYDGTWWLPNAAIKDGGAYIVGDIEVDNMNPDPRGFRTLLKILDYQRKRFAVESLSKKFSKIYSRLSRPSVGRRVLGKVEDKFTLLSFERDYLLTLVPEKDYEPDNPHFSYTLTYKAIDADAMLGFRRDKRNFIHIKEADVEYDALGRRTESHQVTWLVPVKLRFSASNLQLQVEGHILRQTFAGTMEGIEYLPARVWTEVPSMDVDDEEEDDRYQEEDDQEKEKELPRRRSRRLQNKQSKHA